MTDLISRKRLLREISLYFVRLWQRGSVDIDEIEDDIREIIKSIQGEEEK